MRLPAWVRPLNILVFGFVSCLGCSNSDSPTTPTPSAAPTRDSPVNAVRLLEWCWEQQSTAHYAPLLTADFVFRFDPGDSVGNHFPDRALTRAQELAAAQAIFSTGTGSLPKASAIQLDLGTTLVATPDPRPGKNGTWHQVVDVRFDLTVSVGRSYRVVGGSTFYLVREDSAQVVLESRAATGDTTHSWYLERWEERPTIAAELPGLETAVKSYDSPIMTWGQLQSRYLDLPVSETRAAGLP